MSAASNTDGHHLRHEREFGFDYLRDNGMATRNEQQVQRGYYFAIVDEVDSILIDEARTPLIISGPATISTHQYDKWKPLVEQLVRKQNMLCNRVASEAIEAFEKADAKPAKKAERIERRSVCSCSR